MKILIAILIASSIISFFILREFKKSPHMDDDGNSLDDNGDVIKNNNYDDSYEIEPHTENDH